MNQFKINEQYSGGKSVYGRQSILVEERTKNFIKTDYGRLKIRYDENNNEYVIFNGYPFTVKIYA